MFPAGRPGIALVIVRLSLLSMLLIHGYRFGPIVAFAPWTPLLVLVAIALCVGVLTTIASILLCMAEFAFFVTVTGFDVSVLILSIPIAIALLLLGPGAYSLDARVFGRRVIVLPPGNDKQ